MLNRAPLPLTLRQLQYVIAVADSGSFRRAAELCRVAQPSLSTQIAEVERALGVRLFERDRFVVAVGAGHPLARSSKPLATDALRGEELLLLGEGHCLRNQALSACARGRRRESPFGATSLATLTQMVAAGRGVTLLPSL